MAGKSTCVVAVHICVEVHPTLSDGPVPVMDIHVRGKEVHVRGGGPHLCGRTPNVPATNGGFYNLLEGCYNLNV